MIRTLNPKELFKGGCGNWSPWRESVEDYVEEIESGMREAMMFARALKDEVTFEEMRDAGHEKAWGQGRGNVEDVEINY